MLERLVLENFKSFGGRQEIEFSKALTAVVGPNGAGKSNLLEALSFVLGLNSSKLRSKKLIQLIHEREKAAGAAVEVVMSKEGERIKLRRTIVASGASGYSVNGVQVNRSEYEIALQKIGVLSSAKNFAVGQGDVDSLARSSEQELGAVLEEVSGSTSLRIEYDEAKLKKEACETQCDEAVRAKKDVSRAYREAKVEQREAQAWKKLVDASKAKKREVVLLELIQYERSLIERKEKVEACEKALKALKAAEVEANQRLQALDASSVHDEHALAQFRKRTLQARTYRLGLIAQLTAAKKVVKASESALATIRQKLQQDETQLSTLREHLIQLDTTLTQNVKASTPAAVLLESSHDLRSQFAAASDKLGDAALRTEAAERLASQAHENLHDYILRIHALQLDLEVCRTRCEQKEGIALDRSQSSSSSSHDEKSSPSQEEYSRLVRQLSTARSDEAIKTKAVEHKLDEVARAKQSIREDIVDLGRNTWNNPLDFGARRVDRLQRAFGKHRVLGRLLDICKPSQRKYDKALAAAMGSLTEAIVVDSRMTAIQCVAVLRDHRLGSASFLPADGLRLGDEAQLARVDDTLRTLGQGYKLAKDLVVMTAIEDTDSIDDDDQNDREAAIRRGLALVLEGTVIADDLKSARALRYDQSIPGLIKVATLSGALVTAGAMTGGAPPRAQRLAVSTWRRADVERLEGERRQLLTELDAARRKRRALEDIELPEVKRKLAAQQALKDAELRQVNDRQQRQHFEYQRLDRAQHLYEAAQYSDEYAALAIDTALADANLRALRDNDLTAAEDTFLRPVAESFEVDHNDLLAVATARGLRRGYTFYATEEAVKSQMQTARSKAKLSAQVEYERRRLAELEHSIQARQQSRLPELEAALALARNTYTELEAKCTAANEALASAEEAERIAGNTKNTEEKRAPLAEAKQDAVDQLRAATRKKTQHQQAVRELEAKIKAAIAQATLDHIRVPLQHSEHGDTFDLSAAETELFSNNESDDDDDDDDDDDEALEKRQRARRAELESLETRAQKLAPNMKASERCEALADELKAADAVGRALRDEARSAAALFEDIKQRRRTLFSSCLDTVAARLATLYAELTRSSRHPTGGAASLAPLDADEPYLAGLAFHATPPSKRFCDIHQLSGGERALASLALLFAIHDVHQAPFLLLDEVDANLDAANLHQLAAFAANRTHTQIVAVTHKEPFYVHAHLLVGVAKDAPSAASLAFSLDLAARFDTLNINDEAPPAQESKTTEAPAAFSKAGSEQPLSSGGSSSSSSDEDDDDDDL